MEYALNIDSFQGPLDLLLHLIKEAKMDIFDLKIEEITNQYLEFINKMEEMNLNVASSYLVMSAELLEIKTKYADKRKSEISLQTEINIENEPTNQVYMKYKEFCIRNSLQELSSGEFSKQVKKYFNFVIIDKKIQGKKCRIFIKADGQ